MDLGRGRWGSDGPGFLNQPVDPIRHGIGDTGGCGTGGTRVWGFGDGEAESGEGSVAVGSGPVELLREQTVEIEAGPGERREGLTVAPVEREEPASFPRGRAGYGGLLDERDGRALLGQEVSRADSYNSPSADHHAPQVRMLLFHG